jgi:putative tributyrin esterase
MIPATSPVPPRLTATSYALSAAIRKFPVFCLLLLLSCTSAFCQKGSVKSTTTKTQFALVKDQLFHSPSLQRDMHYRILLPRDYGKSGRFPVLYLLHGLFGDYQNWDTRTQLEDYARNIPLLVVMPDADDSWYTNSATVPADKFEDYIAKDLIAEIDGKYRTIRDKHARAIAGLSMGGYGAVKIALKYPDLFAFAGSLSGALNAAQNLDVLRPEFRARLLEVFGNQGNAARAENDVFLLLDASHQLAYPYFYLACGTEDSFLDTNRAFALQLSSQKIAYEYYETPGAHSWDYWDSSLPAMLHVLERTVAGTHPVSR